jgi:UDP-glucuronate 4-epimerase
VKVLVTGNAGFIGFHTAKRLLERGDTVVGFDVVNDYYDPAPHETHVEIRRAGICRSPSSRRTSSLVRSAARNRG